MKHNFLHYLITVTWYIVKDGFQATIAFVIGLFGIYLYWEEKIGPWRALIAIPLSLGAFGIMINKLYSIILSITSQKFNETECLICSRKLS